MYLLVSNELPDILVVAKGGKGGSGESGGDGGDGKDGFNGKTGEKESIENFIKKKFNSSKWNYYAYRFRRLGTDGGKGGHGGDAGAGGFGGDYGDGGQVKLVALDELDIELYRGNDGDKNSNNGTPGKPGKNIVLTKTFELIKQVINIKSIGEAGKHGSNGLDLVAVSDSGNFLQPSQIFSDRKIICKYGRLFESDRSTGDLNESSGDNFEFLPMYDPDSTPGIVDRDTGLSANSGKEAIIKHTNREIAKKVHAINYQNIYEQARECYEKLYGNPLTNSFQHWQAKHLSEFTDKMSFLEGQPIYKINQLPEVNQITREISIMKENLMNTFNSISNKLLLEAFHLNQNMINNSILSDKVTTNARLFKNQQIDVNQNLKTQKQSFNFEKLSNGLQVKAVEMIELNNSFNRLVKEKRFNKDLNESRRRILYLQELPNEVYSDKLINKQNIRVISKAAKNTEFKQFEKTFSDEFKRAIDDFNKNLTEEALLTCGSIFIERCSKLLNFQKKDEFFYFKSFLQTYKENLKVAKLNALHLNVLNKQSEDTRQLLLKLSSVSNSEEQIDLLINFEKHLNIEYSRHYSINQVYKTLVCLRELNSKIAKKHENDLNESLNALMKSYDTIQKQFNDSIPLLLDFEIDDTSITAETQFVSFCSIFYKKPTLINFISVFSSFSAFKIFKDVNEYFEFLKVKKKVQMIEDFLYAYQHNFQFFDLKQENYQQLYTKIEKIESFLHELPHSIFHEKFFDFTIGIEFMKLVKRDESDEHSFEKLVDICKKKDINKLRVEFRLPCKANGSAYDMMRRLNLNEKFTLEQLLVSFISSPSLGIAEQIFKKIEKEDINKICQVNNSLKLFFDHFLENLKNLKTSEIKLVKVGLKRSLMKCKNYYELEGIKIQMKFLDLVLTFEEIKFNCFDKVQKTTNEDLSESMFATVKYLKILIDEFKKNDETSKKKIQEIFEMELNNTMEELNETQAKNILNVKLDEIHQILDNIFLKEERTINKMGSSHRLIYCRSIITKQIEENKKKENSKIMVHALQDLIKNAINLDEFVKLELLNRMRKFELDHEALIDEANFCRSLNSLSQLIDQRVINYLNKNNELVIVLRSFFLAKNEMNKFLHYEDNAFLKILKLCEYSKTDETIGKIVNQIVIDLSKGTQHRFHHLIAVLINEYLDLHDYYRNLKSFINSKDFKFLQNSKNLEILLLSLFKQTSNHPMTSRMYESFNNQIKSANFNQDTFEYMVHFKKLIDDLSDDLKEINISNAASSQLTSLILDNILNNSKWSDLKTKSFADFLTSLFKAFKTYEKEGDAKMDFQLMPQLIYFMKNYSLEDPEKNKEYKEILNNFSGSVKLSFMKEKSAVLAKKDNAKILEIIHLFPEYFEDNQTEIDLFLQKKDEKTQIEYLKELVFNKLFEYQKICYQELKSSKAFKEITKNQGDQIEKLENILLNINGSFLKLTDKNACVECLQNDSYKVLNFNRMLNKLNLGLKINENLSISFASFLKCFQCFKCFIDISVVASVFTESEPKDWLHNIIVESVIEKYCLLYLNKYSIRCLNDEKVMLMRSKMKNINDKIFFVFNNLFTNEYIEMRCKNKSAYVERAKLTEDKFDSLINLMQGLVYSKNILDQLSDATLTIWETILNEVIFNQYFNKKINDLNINTSNQSVEKLLIYLNRIRLQLGNENKNYFMIFFNDIFRKLKEDSIDEIIKLIELIHYKYITIEEACGIVSKKEISTWSCEIQKIKLAFLSAKHSENDRSAHQIIDIMLVNQSAYNNSISKAVLQGIADEAESFKREALEKKSNSGDDKSKVETEIQNILNKKEYQKDPETYVRDNLKEIVSLLLYAWYACNKPQFPKDAQIVSLLIFIHSRETGMLEQIKTGEGKTLIVALTAAFMALCGKAVDIVSSNRDLSIEGEKKCHSFYNLLKIECAHNLSEDDEEKNQAYRPNIDTHQGNIVYGEVSSFQRDILEEEFNNKKIFGKRYQSRGKCLIVDEVDNMCLDKARNVLYLSHEIECLKWLESLFIMIWAAVLRADIKNYDDVSANVAEIAKFMQNCIKIQKIQIPSYLQDYISYKLDRWVESAFQARLMRENDHFIVDFSQSDSDKKERKIIVVDKDTGVEQYSTKWSNGLAQFLELKYRRKISIESLKAVFISNKSFFQRYKNCLFGLTGTLGSETSIAFLSDMYGVRFADIPTSKNKCFYMLPSVVEFEFVEWLESIAVETQKHSEKRPVLIICENLELSNHIYKQLISNSVSPNSIVKYTREGDNVEDRFNKKPATCGDIIIATNKGGRGTGRIII